MSRRFAMEFTITGLSQGEIPDVLSLLDIVWTVEGHEEHGIGETGKLLVWGEGNLSGGETDGAFARRAAKEIWHTLGRYVRVEVRATCLEDIPYETHVLDEDDYADRKGS